jgi:hypothetical protein
MNLSRNTTIILIILLIVIGIVGTYYMMNWGGIDLLNNQNLVSYNDNELKEYVSDFVKREFGSGYKPSDIFIFKDSSYYISVIETDTGRGAFEMLFDPDTREFKPEPGPNMVWNEKYGMMGKNMMGLNQIFENDYNKNQVSRKEALVYAKEYLDKNEGNIEVNEEGHEFYGYYTFHTKKDNKSYGMLSVNGRTGEVWYHDWHGELEKIIAIEEHDKDENH